ncbi:MAG: hypothetical protein WC427_01435 [Candidatus Paceibacterota bacterium]
MEIAIKRILGIALIVFGLAIFFWSISESYYYFSAQKEFPPVFVQPQTSASATPSASSGTLQDQMNALIGNQINEKIKEMLPANTITDLLNASIWIAFATFLVYAGARAVGMGRDFLNDASKQAREEKNNI